MKKGELIELSNNSQKWIEEANFAAGNMSYLTVHPSHIISLVKAAKSFEASQKELKEAKEALDRLKRFLEGLEAP